MIRASVVFFVLGLLSLSFGLNQIAGISFEVGRFLLLAFLSLAVVTFIASLLAGRQVGPKQPQH